MPVANQFQFKKGRRLLLFAGSIVLFLSRSMVGHHSFLRGEYLAWLELMSPPLRAGMSEKISFIVRLHRTTSWSAFLHLPGVGLGYIV